MLVKEDAQGHRRRLREKFLSSGLESFHDYEIIELLLSLGTPRTDCKTQAKEAMKRFKSLRGVLEASEKELQNITGIGPHSVFGIKFVQAVAREFLKQKSLERPLCSSSKEVFDYFYYSMRDLKKEVVKTIFLNSANQILEIEEVSSGTVNSSYIHPREVIEKALKHSAVSIILVHNHPSGNISPSGSDEKLTGDLFFAASYMDISLLDHIIIGDNRYYSFASEGKIAELNDKFQKLKNIVGI
jgi:DNA repair protein RadC